MPLARTLLLHVADGRFGGTRFRLERSRVLSLPAGDPDLERGRCDKIKRENLFYNKVHNGHEGKKPVKPTAFSLGVLRARLHLVKVQVLW